MSADDYAATPDSLADYLTAYEISCLPYSSDLRIFYGWEQDAIDLFSNMRPSEQHTYVLSAADAASRSGAHYTQVGAFLYVMLREAARNPR